MALSEHSPKKSRILKKSRIKADHSSNCRRHSDEIQNVKHLKEIVFIDKRRLQAPFFLNSKQPIAPKCEVMKKRKTNQNLNVYGLIKLLNTKICNLVTRLIGSSEKKNIYTTRIPIKKGSNLIKKIQNEMEDVKPGGIFSLITPSMFLKNWNNNKSNRQIYHDSNFVDKNYNLIFEKMKETDEKNKYMAKKLIIKVIKIMTNHLF